VWGISVSREVSPQHVYLRWFFVVLSAAITVFCLRELEVEFEKSRLRALISFTSLVLTLATFPALYKWVDNVLRAPPAPSVRDDVKGYREVFYATDRKPLENQRYSGEASESEELQFGKAVVSIPKSHKHGELERPWSIFSVSLPENARDHIVIAGSSVLSDGDFYTQINRAIDSAPDRSAFVFVHGFNVSFDDAILRTGQLAWDLKFRGPALAYSWPSLSSTSQYVSDLEMADWTAPHLAAFLHTLRLRTGVRRVHLVAHSMGTRAMLMALDRLANGKLPTPKFQELILAAPDINRLVFNQLSQAVRDQSDRTTIYASQRDWALALSAWIRNGKARTGSVASALPNVGFDIIDATKARGSLLGHSYFAEDPELLEDISLLLRLGLKPVDRSITLEEDPPIWVFRP
jgi:esterase/lipase superfamily enzyme